MNSRLLSNRPNDLTEEKFKEYWESCSYTLEPLFKTIMEFTPKETISKDDFDKPAFVEKMIWVQAQRDLANKILELFPKSLTA